MAMRSLTRREALALLGATGAAAAGAAARADQQSGALPACIVRPEQTQGPYFVDERLHRSDITTDPATGSVRRGAPLALAFEVSRMTRGGCEPLPAVQVDVWQCDAHGVYSDVRDRMVDSTGQKFLRGYQTTDAAGRASFRTIYPGWYSGRAVHVHFKVRMPRGPRNSGRASEFTSQIYFDEEVTDRVHREAPYNTRRQGRVPNVRDRMFRDGGERLLVSPRLVNGVYTATFTLGLAL